VKHGDTTLVKVTDKHIKAGVERDCVLCPVALAVADAVDAAGAIGLPGSSAYADLYLISVRVPGSEAPIWYASAPPEVEAFIHRFDGGETVEPFEFELTWRDYCS
jgi:hypothetical protein